MAKLSFYDMKGRKKVSVDESKVKYITKNSKRGKIKMATAKAPAGNTMYRIVGKG